MNHTIINNFSDFIDRTKYQEQIEDLHLAFELIISNFNVKHIYALNFKNCIFSKINIRNLNFPDLNIQFINCIFEDEITINNNHINDLTISFFEYKEIYKITSSKLGISDNKFEGRCKINNLIFQGGAFHFIGNTFTKTPTEIIPKRETNHNVCEIRNSTINNGSFNNNSYYMPFYFTSNTLTFDSKYSGHSFRNNLFQKTDFSHTNFGTLGEFRKCDFLGTALFTYLKSNISILNFHNCKFIGFTHFSNSQIKCLSIEFSTFERSTSFKELNVDNIILSEIKFEKGAYFDDIKINNILNKTYLQNDNSIKIKEWKHTLRLIKQELQKTENKIDFNRFRNYELATYYKELKFWDSPIDKIILFTTKWSTNFGSWFWAFCFTLITGFSWYCILYFWEHNGSYNPDRINDFVTGSFRFFLITDFYSPFEDRKYLTDAVSWFPFVIGKIVIAFGIYEMIQAFRKFKV